MTQDVTSLEDLVARLPSTPNAERQLWVDASGRVIGRFYGCSLASVFAPIVDAYDGRIKAKQALIRSYAADGDGLDPWKLFELAASDSQLIALDRLCRTVHTINFLRETDEASDLHLHVHGRLLCAVKDEHGMAFARVLQSLGGRCERFVITLPSKATEDMTLLQFVVANYRWNGFRVAVTAKTPDQARQIAATLRPEFVRVPLARVRESSWTAQDLGSALLNSASRLIVTGVDDPARVPTPATPNLVLTRGKVWPPHVSSLRGLSTENAEGEVQ